MSMSSRLRKIALTAHITSSVGWIGAVVAFLALAVAGVTSHDAQLVRAAYLAMGVVSYIIVALAFASLLTGLVLSLGTTWGLFRHYWVLIKFLLTVLAVIVLLVQMQPISHLASIAADPSSSVAALRETKRPLIHAAGGLLVLLVVQVLGLYKPRGMTRYGWRKQHEQPAKSASQYRSRI
jgi:hypothetical protein